MNCTQCSKKIPKQNQKHKPFCSERCRLIDLNNWLTGEYKIPESEKNLNFEEQILLEKLRTESSLH